jgi:hypothetical protein
MEEKNVIDINWADRWQVYQRLRELDIPCTCEVNQPLRVKIATPISVLQAWSVMRQITAPRQDKIWSLERCWCMRHHKF